ncbi:hypothetical protein COBT_002775, partial [Conglomerata obtusa]
MRKNFWGMRILFIINIITSTTFNDEQSQSSVKNQDDRGTESEPTAKESLYVYKDKTIGDYKHEQIAIPANSSTRANNIITTDSFDSIHITTETLKTKQKKSA